MDENSKNATVPGMDSETITELLEGDLRGLRDEASLRNLLSGILEAWQDKDNQILALRATIDKLGYERSSAADPVNQAVDALSALSTEQQKIVLKKSASEYLGRARLYSNSAQRALVGANSSWARVDSLSEQILDLMCTHDSACDCAEKLAQVLAEAKPVGYTLEEVGEPVTTDGLLERDSLDMLFDDGGETENVAE